MSQMTIDDQVEEPFAVACRRILEEHGGRLERNELGRLVRAELGDERTVSLMWPQFVDKVVSQCRQRDGQGLPLAQAFDGEVVQRRLWKVDEYRLSISSRASSIAAERAVIRRLIAECEQRHQVKLTTTGEVAA